MSHTFASRFTIILSNQLFVYALFGFQSETNLKPRITTTPIKRTWHLKTINKMRAKMQHRELKYHTYFIPNECLCVQWVFSLQF